jgi:RNA polymerase sigma factor (TIGR02999 family)
VLGFRHSEAAPISPTPAGFQKHAHLALRRNSGKTVMPLENFRGEAVPDLGLGSTPDDREALNQLFSLTYEELRRLANSVKRGDPSLTLSPTALVNEAWLKLAKSPGVSAASRIHFKRIAARAMRQLLIEAARRRNARKRGGEEATFIQFDDSIDVTANGADLLVLDAALDELARLEPRQATIVESRFFGGFEMSEIADMLGVSEATVLRDWRAAKAWLGNELRRRQ